MSGGGRMNEWEGGSGRGGTNERKGGREWEGVSGGGGMNEWEGGSGGGRMIKRKERGEHE